MDISLTFFEAAALARVARGDPMFSHPSEDRVLLAERRATVCRLRTLGLVKPVAVHGSFKVPTITVLGRRVLAENMAPALCNNE